MAAHDVIITGAGPAGLALAALLSEQALSVAVLDARPLEAGDEDPRAFALAHGSRLTLQRLGAWNGLEATPIETIHVSQHGGFGRTRIESQDLGVPALGYVTHAGILTRTLRKQAERCGVTFLPETRMSDHRADTDKVYVETENPQAGTLQTRLLVRAEGTDQKSAHVNRRDYDQVALVASLRPRGGHRHLAYERFTDTGPIALLPFGHKDYALVHVMPPAQAERSLQLGDTAYLDELQRRLGGRLRFEHVGKRNTFPLGLQYLSQPVAPRTVWIGNAAQTLHPVAGQGFNLALRDAWALADTLRHQPGDPGNASTLRAYARGRRLDRDSTIGFTDTLVRIFSNDCAGLQHLRGAALYKLDTCGPLRRFLARRMMFGARAWP